MDMWRATAGHDSVNSPKNGTEGQRGLVMGLLQRDWEEEGNETHGESILKGFF
eukprot:GDKH01012081.1.p5 GENE.GDKH01012081.1~~GDKH01012081.1.p5  ORF type:complete len:53 (+),score=3.60 GDKH01012081.1:104-262(+)